MWHRQCRLAVRVSPRKCMVEEIARGYTSLDLMTNEPVLVDPELAMLCVGVSQQHVDDPRERSGPHAHTSIRIYMNDIASAAFRRSVKTYPIGSVIVKEKQGLAYNTRAVSGQHDSRTTDGVGGMIKRAPGYDPDHGDWEYFYFEAPSRIEHGTITSCIECHRGASASDYVFGRWAEGG
jgi:hypothetical protein